MRIRKIATLLMTTIMLSSSISIIANAQTFTNESLVLESKISQDIKVDNKKIKNFISDYFNWFYENLKTNATDEELETQLNELVANKELINFKKTKLQWMKQFLEASEDSVNYYKTFSDIDSIEVNENLIYVNVLYSEDLVLKNSLDVVQKIKDQEHKIVLKYENDKFSVINDYYSDTLLNETFDISEENLKDNKTEISNNRELQKRANSYKAQIENIPQLVEKNKTDLELTSRLSATNKINDFGVYRYAGYNAEAARSYAATHYNNYNPAYSRYDGAGQGGDCTNFVSQCIRAGGIPTDGTWFKDSVAWVNVVKFRDWLVNRGYARELSWQENSKVGDIVQKTNASGNWGHGLIITYKRTDGQLFVSAHSGDYYNRSLALYDGSKRYLILTS